MSPPIATRRPKLRFPEFRDVEEWKEKKLGEMTDVRDGTHDSPKFLSKGRPLVTSKNLFEDGTLDLNNVSLICEEDYEQINKRSKVDAGDILFGMIGTIGNPVLVRFDGFAIKNVALFKQKTELLNSYLVQLLRSQHIAKKLSVINSGNSQKFVALGQLRGLSIPTPSIPEQQKIADCLSSLDELITLEAQKLDSLKTHKKGLMQQLFPRDGETLPKLRFPEFRDVEEWEEKRLSEVINLEYGSSLPESKRKDGTILVVGSNGIIGYHDECLVTGPAIVIGRKGSVGQVNWIEQDCYPIDTTYYVNNKNPQSYLLSFLCTLLEHSNLPHLKDPSAVPGLNRDSAHSLMSFFPQPPEQQKISDCLSSLDNLIIAQTQKLDTLKTHKKGLMQQLFPSFGREDDEAERVGRPVVDEAQG